MRDSGFPPKLIIIVYFASDKHTVIVYTNNNSDVRLSVLDLHCFGYYDKCPANIVNGSETSVQIMARHFAATAFTVHLLNQRR